MVAGMSALVYYVLPGLLGRAYDLKNNTVGPDLFRVDEANKALVIKKYTTTSDYKVVTQLTEAKDFLDVNGKLAMGIKSGMAKLEGAGDYLKDTTSYDKRVDLLVRAHYETICKTMPSEIKPMDNWADAMKGTHCTHYIRTICYGGDLIASVRFTAKSDEDKEVIKATVSGELNSESGSFGGGLKGNLEKVKEKIGETAHMDINYFATVPLSNTIPRTIDGLVQLVQDFPNATKAVNDGYGVPLNMEVFSLEALDRDTQTYYQTEALLDQMTVVDEMFSDTMDAQKRLSNWMQSIPPNLPEEQNNKIGLFATKLDQVIHVFTETMTKLDLTPEGSADQFKEAFEAYKGDHEESIPNLWVKDVTKLKKDVLKNTPSLEGDYGGAHYTHWGSEECPTDTSLVINGVMSTTDKDNVGASQYTCLPKEMQYPTVPEPEKDADQDIDDFPHVQQVAFISRKKGAGNKKQTVPCASCRVPGKSTTTMLVAKKECPSGWRKLYEGVLISTDYQTVRGELVCLDTSKPLKEVSIDSDDLTVATEASPKCGNFPCSNGVSVNTALPCVVCGITKKSESYADLLRL